MCGLIARTYLLSSVSTTAMADTAAASVASTMTSAAVAASAAATAGLDSSGNHILTQILISGIVDLWLFTVDILVC